MMSKRYLLHIQGTHRLYMRKYGKYVCNSSGNQKQQGRDKMNFIPEIITRDKDHYVMIRAIRLSRSYNNH